MTDIIYKSHPRSSNIKIKVDSAGQVTVISPRWTPGFVVRRYVESQSAWIEGTLAKIKAKKTAVIDDSSVLIFGQKYIKEITSSLDFAYGVNIVIADGQKKLQINNFGKEGKTHTQLLERFLKNTAEKYITPRTHALAKKMNLSFNNLTLRQQKTRWGSCSSRGNLNFNWRLVHYLPNIIDYVIIHELAHLVHMNHSVNFWNLVKQYDPEYLKHRGFLKRCGMNLG